MGTCYSKRSACYNLSQHHQSTATYEMKQPETPATLRRFSSLRHSVKSFTSLAHNRRSLRYKPVTFVMSPNKHSMNIGGSTRNKHWCVIKYNETKEALV